MSATERFWLRARLRQFPQLSASGWILVALVLLAFALRAPGLARPLLGNFATKNVAYAMIARNFARGRADLLSPTLDCLRGDDRALHLLELPLSAYLSGGLWAALGGSLDLWGRSMSLAFSIATVPLVYLLVRRKHSSTAALAAAACFALSPVSVIYGQSFTLEASLTFFAVAALLAFDVWVSAPKASMLALAGISLALALLTKIYLLALLLPIVWSIGIAWKHRSLSSRQLFAGLLVLGCAALPAATWCWHAARIADPASPDSARVFYSVRDSAAAHRPPHPLLAEPAFYARLGKNLIGVALTPIGCALALLGLARKESRAWLPWLVACAFLVALLPRKFHEMNYYYLPIVPPLCILAGLGWERLRAAYPSRHLAMALSLAALAFSVRYFARPAYLTPAEDRGVLAAALAVQQRVPPGEPVATMHGSTFDLLYYCDRTGWFVSPDDPRLPAVLADCHRRGARWLAVAHSGQGPVALASLPVAVQGPQFTLYALPAASSLERLAAHIDDAHEGQRFDQR